MEIVVDIFYSPRHRCAEIRGSLTWNGWSSGDGFFGGKGATKGDCLEALDSHG